MSAAPVLVLFAHPARHRSRINAQRLAALSDLPQVLIRDLYDCYPDFDIDVAAEQRLLRAARLLVFMHPVYWYSAPAILKAWLDEVLTRGFAYGQGGDALQGKSLLQVVSTGAPESSYTSGGYHHYPLGELLRPFEQTARFCGMHYLPPVVLHQAGQRTPRQIDADVAEIRRRLNDYIGDAPGE